MRSSCGSSSETARHNLRSDIDRLLCTPPGFLFVKEASRLEGSDVVHEAFLAVLRGVTAALVGAGHRVGLAGDVVLLAVVAAAVLAEL